MRARLGAEPQRNEHPGRGPNTPASNFRDRPMHEADKRDREKTKPTKEQADAKTKKREAMPGPEDEEHADLARDRNPKPEEAEKVRKASQKAADEED